MADQACKGRVRRFVNRVASREDPSPVVAGHGSKVDDTVLWRIDEREVDHGIAATRICKAPLHHVRPQPINLVLAQFPGEAGHPIHAPVRIRAVMQRPVGEYDEPTRSLLWLPHVHGPVASQDGQIDGEVNRRGGGLECLDSWRRRTSGDRRVHQESDDHCTNDPHGRSVRLRRRIATGLPPVDPLHHPSGGRFAPARSSRYPADPMDTSVIWLNDYLDPPATADEQAELLTRAGFPLEGREDVALVGGTDVRQDYEMTSNRGDAVCHVGLAREIAAISGRTLKARAARPSSNGHPAADHVSVTNHEHRLCPLYTGRLIKGVKIGPSPEWLADRLRARGDIPRNNVVDATNFVLFELGQPTHVFDIAKLKGQQIIVRMATPGEPFLPIGEGESEVKLSDRDLVIADAERAVAIAGVKGGALTAVTDSTTDILLEAASFDPVCVRNSSRRLNIASDSSYRFERGVHPGQVNAAADRLAELILEVAGGELFDGVVSDGAPIPQPRTASMRTDRCRQLLGVSINDEQMLDFLDRLGFQPKLGGGRIGCTVPVQRLDIEREIDLIEEVGRMFGHDNIPIDDALRIRIAPPQSTELARQDVSNELVGLGFVESVTHSLVSDRAARAFLPPGMSPLQVEDERAGAEPVLRPSIIPSLLRVYALNCDGGAKDVKLFESAATFAMQGDDHLETNNLALLHPPISGDSPLRETRGIVDRLIALLRGSNDGVTVEPLDDIGWFEPGAAVRVHGDVIGTYGMMARHVLDIFGIDDPVCAGEFGLPKLYGDYPPETEAHALPSFPAIERDLSLIIDESVTWATITEQISALNLDLLEADEFVTTFRGKQVGAGRKSLTLRLRFRAPDRTLRHDEVDPQMESVVATMHSAFNAEIRA